MNRNLHPTLLSLFILALLPVTTWAETQVIHFFDVIPGNCIIKANDTCKVSFHFRWQLQQAEKICIYQQPLKDAIYCGPINLEDETQVELDVQERTEFTLIPFANSHLSSSKSVDVLVVGQDVRLLRRHVWSIF